MTLEWSPQAAMQVDDIVSRIAADDPVAAARWLAGLRRTVQRLIDFPASGRVVPEFGVPDLREVVFGHYRIVYWRDEPVRIVTVRHAARWMTLDER